MLPVFLFIISVISILFLDVCLPNAHTHMHMHMHIHRHTHARIHTNCCSHFIYTHGHIQICTVTYLHIIMHNTTSTPHNSDTHIHSTAQTLARTCPLELYYLLKH